MAPRTAELPTWHDVCRQLRISSAQQPIRAKHIEREDLIRVDRGVYLPWTYLASLSTYWQLREAIDCARAWALTHRSRAKGVLIGQSAALPFGVGRNAVLRHFDTWTANNSACSTPIAPLPEVVLPTGQVIDRIPVRKHSLAVPESAVMNFFGTATMSLPWCAVSSALIDGEAEAFTVACGVLRELSSFERRDLAAARAREEEARASLLRAWDQLGSHVRGRLCARWIIENADAGCESVGECRLMWILRRAGFVEICSQMPVMCSGRRYFVDIAIPRVGIACEFDGRAKMGNDRNQVLDALAHQTRRQKDLEEQGLTVLRFSWDELSDPDRIVREINGRIAQRTLNDHGGAGK